MKTPFSTKSGKVKFPWNPTADRVFIFPSPPPETIGEKRIILIPEKFREEHIDQRGILLAVGPGFFDDKGRWNPTPPELVPGVTVIYDYTVPWRALARGQDKEKHLVVLCGVGDILGVVQDG